MYRTVSSFHNNFYKYIRSGAGGCSSQMATCLLGNNICVFCTSIPHDA